MILCANTHVTEPPVDLASSAIVATTGATSISLSGYAYVYGITFKATSGGSTGNVLIGAGTSASGFDLQSCGFQLFGTSATSTVAFGQTAASGNLPVLVSCSNCVFKFNSTSQQIKLRNGRINLSGCSIDSGGSLPTTFFGFTNGCYGYVTISAWQTVTSGNMFDISAAAGHLVEIRDSIISLLLTAGTRSDIGSPTIRALNVAKFDLMGDGKVFHFIEDHYLGQTIEETTIVAANGASDGVNSYSYKITTTNKCSIANPYLVRPPMFKHNTATGASKTFSVEILHDSATALKDSEVWLSVDVLDNVSGYQYTRTYTDRAASVIAAGANQPSSSASWTTTGMTAPNKQKLEVTATPQLAGYMRGSVVCAKPSKTFYLNPMMAIS